MHSFNENVAAQYGIAEAVLIDHFQYWIKLNKRNERHDHEGRTWTYATAKSLSEWFPYLSEKQIWLAISKLVDAGVLIKGNFNRTKYDRTTWYAFTLESFWIKPEGDFHFPKVENHKPQTAGPIPAPETDTTKTTGTGSSAANATGDKKPTGQKKRERKAPGAGDTDWQRWVDRYDQHVKKFNEDLPHRWDGAQLGPQGLKGIRQHLVKISTKIEGKSEEDCGYGAWCYILDHWETLPDEWLRGQFDLTVLLKKITDILNRLKNGTQTNRGNNTGGVKPGTSQQRVDALENY